MQPTCIAVDPFQKNRVYCGTFGRGLWLSDDSGDSWRPIGDSYRYFDFPKEDGILHSSITSITISPNEKVNGYGVVYVGTEPSALFRSENGGETWTELKNMKSLLSSYTWAFLLDLSPITYAGLQWIHRIRIQFMFQLKLVL